MGLTDLQTTGTFLWNSTGVGLSYTNWYSTSLNEHCAVFLGTDYNGLWYLFNCYDTSSVVCQTPGNNCDWELIGNKIEKFLSLCPVLTAPFCNDPIIKLSSVSSTVQYGTFNFTFTSNVTSWSVDVVFDNPVSKFDLRTDGVVSGCTGIICSFKNDVRHISFLILQFF